MKTGPQRSWLRTLLMWLLSTWALTLADGASMNTGIDSVPVDVVSAEEEANELDIDLSDGLWFPVGETLHYKVYWGVVPVARTTATTEWVEEEGKKYLSIRFRTRSNRVLQKIYPVDDLLETVIDPDTFLPIRFSKKLSEGRYRCDETTVFDRERLKATWTKNGADIQDEYDINPHTRDLISFMYAMRSQDPEVGARRKYRVMADEKLYDLWVKSEKKEKVKLDGFGKVDSIQLKPEAAFQGLFIRKGDMTLWVSEDDRRIITKASVDLPVANVNIKLDKVTGPGDDAWVRAKKKTKKKVRRKRQ